jgi:hypothetical protein
VPGVATNSKGHVFVYTRTGTMTATLGGSRVFTHNGSRLFEFDEKGAYVREIGVGIYGFLFAHVVRIDPQDNIWVVDEGANLVMKFDPNGRILMTIGRKPESINIRNYEPPAPPAGAAGRGGRGSRGAKAGAGRRTRRSAGGGAAGGRRGRPGEKLQSSDRRRLGRARQHLRVRRLRQLARREVRQERRVPQDGRPSRHGPARVQYAARPRDGREGNVYIADRGNNRIQVLDND